MGINYDTTATGEDEENICEWCDGPLDENGYCPLCDDDDDDSDEEDED